MRMCLHTWVGVFRAPIAFPVTHLRSTIRDLSEILLALGRICPKARNLAESSRKKELQMIDKDDSTRTLRNTKSVAKWLSEAEERAQKLVDEFAPLCAKLKDL